MKKQVLALSAASIMILMPCSVMAGSNYTIKTNTVQSAEQYQQNGYYYDDDTYDTQAYNYDGSNLFGSVVLVPANTTFSAISTSAVSSETAKAGDSVTFYLGSDFYYGSNLIAAAGSRLNGTVLKVKKGGYATKNGQLQIKFSSLVTTSGQTIPISASIQTDDGTGILKAGTGKDTTVEYAKDIGIGAAAGAALGTAMGALSSGSVGKGAIYGTALGGGLGLGKSLIDKGGNVEIPQNSELDIVLDQQLTVSADN